MVTVECQNCGKPVATYPSRVNRTRFCSRTCYAEWLSKNNRGAIHGMYGKHHTEEARRKMSRAALESAKTGASNHNWKGGRYKVRGYVMVALRSLPPEEQTRFASMASRSSGKYIPEHRLVMARQLGRPLEPKEVVHHLNGVKDDNRPENLELKQPSEHTDAYWQLVAEVQSLRRENEQLRAQLSKFLSATSR